MPLFRLTKQNSIIDKLDVQNHHPIVRHFYPTKHTQRNSFIQHSAKCFRHQIESKGDNEHPCLKPRHIRNFLVGEPLTRTDNEAVDTQPLIHALHRTPKPIFSRTASRNNQLTLFQAFSKSTLKTRPPSSLILIASITSFTIKEQSMIWRPLIKENLFMTTPWPQSYKYNPQN